MSVEATRLHAEGLKIRERGDLPSLREALALFLKAYTFNRGRVLYLFDAAVAAWVPEYGREITTEERALTWVVAACPAPLAVATAYSRRRLPDCEPTLPICCLAHEKCFFSSQSFSSQCFPLMLLSTDVAAELSRIGDPSTPGPAERRGSLRAVAVDSWSHASASGHGR